MHSCTQCTPDAVRQLASSPLSSYNADAVETRGDLRLTEKPPYVRSLFYVLRIVAGFGIIGLLLFAASRTTRDCTVGLYVYDICSWVWVREQLGLPASKLLRALFLELIGLTLAGGIYVAIRFVLPFWRTGAGSRMDGQ